MKNKKIKDIVITYVFSNTKRSSMMENREEYSEEFFYGYYSLKSQYKTHLVEFNEKANVFYLVDKLISKFSNMPIFFSFVTSFKNFKIFISSTHIIMTNQRAAIACIPLLLILKIVNNPKVVVFNMGILGRNINYLDKFITFLLLSLSYKFINLGVGENKLMIKKYPNFENKIMHLPFPVDLKFWKNTKKSKQYIIFVGNDSNRDFEFLKKLVSNLKQYNFLLLTNSTIKNDNSILSLKNVEIISGEFGSQNFTDKDLNTLYNKASLSIIPLISGVQPSGQSVAQQSLAVGVPVLITKTDGFWTDLFTIDEGIYMVDENNVNTWTKKIEEILSKKNNQISNESQEIIKSNFSVEKFNKTLESLIIDR